MLRRFGAFLLALAAATAFVLVVVRPDARVTEHDGESAPEAGSPVPGDGGVGGSDPGGRSGNSDAVSPDPSDGPSSIDATGSDASVAAPPTSGADAAGAPLGSVALRAPLPPADALLVEVVRLADGDSFDIRWIDARPDGIRRDEVRLLGINAPESSACFGDEARRELETLIDGEPVLIAIDPDERDDFGRAIADVWTSDGVLANIAMVERGAALALSDAGAHAGLIGQAQVAARTAGRGLWTVCGASAEVVISDLWSDAPGRDDLNPNGEWVEITNLGGEPIDLTGWGLRDESTRHRYVFPDSFVLAPATTVRIGSGCEFHDGARSVDLFWCGEDPVWNNGGDTAFLVDAAGRFVDSWSYDG